MTQVQILQLSDKHRPFRTLRRNLDLAAPADKLFQIREERDALERLNLVGAHADALDRQGLLHLYFIVFVFVEFCHAEGLEIGILENSL